MNVLRVGTRGSALARAQTQIIIRQLQSIHPDLQMEMILCKTTGDRITDRPLHDIGGKGLFTKELEQALLDESIDVAVHSYKDVPVTMPLVDQSDLIVAAVPVREDPRDVLIAKGIDRIEHLPLNARVGTGSLRRQCQLLSIRPDLKIEPIRGNIDTRIRKLIAGEYDAIVIAMAGVKRAGIFDVEMMTPIPLETMLPAGGQGALAIQCRRHDKATREIVGVLDDATTRTCVDLERSVVQRLQGDCHSPIGVLARIDEDRISVRAAVGGRGGSPPLIHANAHGDDALDDVIEQLRKQEAMQLLHGTHHAM